MRTIIADLFAGKIHPRIAAVLTPLLNLQLRAIETTDLARRIAEVKKLFPKTPSSAGLVGKEDAE
jgi:hypothetical protein